VNKDYKIESSIKITDWMVKSDLIPLGDNFDKLLKGFIETPYIIIMHLDIIHWLDLYIYFSLYILDI